ncbi:MAG: YbhB/YbcL family Raf kinase inhibitor-like protein [Chlamydiota bacterium]
MKISSPAFSSMGKIPKKYSCEGQGINPPLQIENIPSQAISLVLIIDDPDAPNGTYVHWVVYNMDPKTTIILENSIPGLQARNTAGIKNYVPPCPPSGTHRYFFKIYALDIRLEDDKNIEIKIQGHILASAELVGLYNKKETHGESQ